MTQEPALFVLELIIHESLFNLFVRIEKSFIKYSSQNDVGAKWVIRRSNTATTYYVISQLLYTSNTHTHG